MIQSGGWTIVCLGGKKDMTGQVPLAAHCRVEKYDFLSLVRVDAQGVHTNIWPIDSLCGDRFQHVGVDGTSIERRPLAEQLQLMRTGWVFGREKPVLWPDCWRSEVEETSLAGFAQAFDIMMARWQRFTRR